jgi:hypothetical protein
MKRENGLSLPCTSFSLSQQSRPLAKAITRQTALANQANLKGISIATAWHGRSAFQVFDQCYRVQQGSHRYHDLYLGKTCA